VDAAALARLAIAQRSPIQQQVDKRPRCQECHRVLDLDDHKAYWDGDDPYVTGCLPRGCDPTPRVCNRCAEVMELHSV